MVTAGSSSFNLGSRLTFIFVALIVLILGGNALVVSQFYLARHVTDRLTGANQQLIAVLQLQANLLSLHRRLDDLSRSVDLSHLVAEARPLRETLREQTQETRTAISNLPPGTVVDPTFLPTLDSIDVTLSSEIEAILELAKSGDRVALPPRVSKEFDPIETQTAILVNSINDQASRELGRDVTEMSSIQHRVLVIVPITALSSFLIAAFFGWSTARRLIELRLEERVDERLRIARELHDTLLQSFQAVLLRFRTAHTLFSTRPEEARQILEGAIDQAREALTEGRQAVQGLRSPAADSHEFEEAIRTLAEELSSSPTHGRTVELRLNVEGTPRSLRPLARDEIYRIAGEALRNAYHHGAASRIEAQVDYGERRFSIRIRDDGKGMDPELMANAAPPGHFGLRGMRERAKEIGGRFTIWSAPGAGTEVELSVPGSMAYEASPPERYAWLTGYFSKLRTNQKS